MFAHFQREFEIYNNHKEYSRKARFAAVDRAQELIEELKEFGLYYTIYDEDDEHSYIRPDCYVDEYDEVHQNKIETLLDISYDTGE